MYTIIIILGFVYRQTQKLETSKNPSNSDSYLGKNSIRTPSKLTFSPKQPRIYAKLVANLRLEPRIPNLESRNSKQVD